MGMNSLDSLLQCLEQGTNEVFVDPDIAAAAIKSLDRMMQFKAEHLS
jgi:quinolinate synthase